ncbi:MAG TPA: hypothetical protein VNK24_06395 [Elusimicrobiota bacterium]|nr:hypothetical protein [Elusimicrobiota bacterium]
MKFVRRWGLVAAPALLVLGAAFLNGCGEFYTNTIDPYSYRAETPADVQAAPSDPTVHSRACEYYLFYLFNWGDAGYAKVMSGLVKDEAHYMIYDPKFDQTYQSWLLGLYIRECTVMTARVGHI